MGVFPRTSRIARILIAVLLAILVSSAPASALFASQFDHQVGHSAGCHQHAKTDRLPVNHQCCATGHQAAMPANAFTGPQLACFHRFGEASALNSHPPLPGRFTFFSCSSDSPVFNPLRI